MLSSQTNGKHINKCFHKIKYDERNRQAKWKPTRKGIKYEDTHTHKQSNIFITSSLCFFSISIFGLVNFFVVKHIYCRSKKHKHTQTDVISNTSHTWDVRLNHVLIRFVKLSCWNQRRARYFFSYDIKKNQQKGKWERRKTKLQHL